MQYTLNLSTPELIDSLQDELNHTGNFSSFLINDVCSRLGELENETLALNRGNAELKAENENLKNALQKTLDAARFKPHIAEILEFHRQEFPFVPGDNSSEHRERYYWLSGFLHAYAEKWADIDDFGTPSK